MVCSNGSVKVCANIHFVLETIQRHIEAFGKFICNVTSQDVYVTACCSAVLLPSCSTFLMSDISKVHLLSEFSGF